MKFNLKVFLNSCRYLLIPTLVIFLLLFLYFLDIKEFWQFISNKSGFAGILRILLFIGELILVYIIYSEDIKKENLKNTDVNDLNIKLKDVDYYKIYEYLNSNYSRKKFDVYSSKEFIHLKIKED